MQIHKIYQCIKPDCHFRFHDQSNKGNEIKRCPKCKGPVKVKIIPPLENENLTPFPEVDFPEMEILLDNVRSTLNVGSVFRTADGVGGINRIHLCGVTPTPDHPKISKTALGAENTIDWIQHWNSLDTALEYKNKGYKIWSIEEGLHAESIFSAGKPTDNSPILLVLGSETSGVDPDILKISDKILMIPMAGRKKSLNVSTAFGIAVYMLRYGSLFR